jgi:L-iditol 2-dehydrogenase
VAWALFALSVLILPYLYVLERLSGGAVSPESLISHRLPLEGLMDGLRIMKEKSEEYGKIMCVF